MDLRKLKTLIDLVESSGIAELEISEGEERVRITRSQVAATGQPVVYPPPPTQAVAVAAAPQAPAPAPAEPAQPEGHAVKSPMVGSFYRCPSFPGNPPIEIEVDNIDVVMVKFGLPFEDFVMHYPYYEKPLWAQIWISVQRSHIETTEEGRSANYIGKEIIQCVDDLMQEKLVSAEWKRKKKSGWQCGLINVDFCQELANRVHFIRCVSWVGTYNRSFDGKWEWGT